MSSPITASFRWTKDEFLRAQRLAVKHSPLGRLINRFMMAIGVLILLSGVVQLSLHAIGWFGFLYTVLFGALFFSMPFFARRKARKFYARKPDRDMEVVMDIAEDGIRARTPVETSENTWAAFPRVVRAREGFLLFPSGRLFQWLPAHAFRDPADEERFAQLARSKVQNYVERR